MLVYGSGVLVSRVLGLGRDVLFASVLGTGPLMAAFVFAFTIPNLFRGLFGEGAFAAAFVPVFSEALEKEDRQTAWQGACRVISVLAVALGGMVLAVMAIAWLSGWCLTQARAHIRLGLELTAWFVPYALLVCLAGALGSVLTSLRRIAVPAFSPVLLNLFLIAAAVGVGRLPEASRMRPALLVAGVLGAGVAQLVAPLWRCRSMGLSFRFSPSRHAPEVRKVLGLLVPVLFGVGILQLNTLVDRMLAFYLGATATSSLYFSQRLVLLPVGLFGVAMGVNTLPVMARAWSRGDQEAMGWTVSYALRQVLFLTLPALAALWVLREPMVRLLFERGSFGELSGRETLWALAFYLPGLPAFVCAKVAVTPFHAAQDTRTPVRIALLCLVMNVVLNLILMQFLKQGGLALATTICAWLNVGLLLGLTRRRLPTFRLRGLLLPVCKTALAALAAGMAAHAVLAALGNSHLLVQNLVPGLVLGGAYLLATAVLRCRELGEVLGSFRRGRGTSL